MTSWYSPATHTRPNSFATDESLPGCRSGGRALFLAHLCVVVLLLLIAPARAQTVPEDFVVEIVHSRPSDKPVGFALLPDERIIVIDHQNGEVNLLVDGEKAPEPMAVFSGLVTGSEQGLLGVAVDPDYPDAPYVYIFYSSDQGESRVSRFALKGDLRDPASPQMKIDLASEQILLAIPDDYERHNGGTLRFGADKTLYVSHGDDMRIGEDKDTYLQWLTNLNGKILRIRRDGSAPPDNPTFPDQPEGARPEVFAIGLRNPFRFAIDPKTQTLFIGDVGEQDREELDLATGGENFGWPRYEGDIFFWENTALTGLEVTEPIHTYDPSRGRSAIALATYRPENYPNDFSFPPEYDGVHFYADYFHQELRYLRPDGQGGFENLVFGSGFPNLTDASIGPDGSLYVLRYEGALMRIRYEGGSVGVDEPPVAAGLTLDQNHPNPFSGRTTVSYTLPAPEHVRLEIFDVLGRRVASLVDAWQSAGTQEVTIDGSTLASGTYLIRLRAGTSTRTRTCVVSR